MKLKLFIFIFCMMFVLIGSVSALEIDNKITYEDNDLNVIFENLFGLGEKLGEARLSSHHSVQEILSVMPGENRIVMKYEFKDWEVYPDGLGKVYFTNMKTGKETEKDYYFAKAIYEEIDVADYGDYICNNITYLNITYEDCEKEVIGFHKELRISKWEKLVKNNILQGNNTIALITDVKSGDHIDGVWTIAGKKIKRHAVWQDNLNNQLIAWYPLDDNTDVTGQGHDLSNRTGTYITAGCKIGDCLSNDYIYGDGSAFSDFEIQTNDNFSWCYWANKTTINTQAVFSVDGAPGVLSGHFNTGTEWTGFLYNYATNADIVDNPPTGWNYLCWTKNSSGLTLWRNGTYIETTVTSGSFASTVTKVIIGADGTGGGTKWEGQIDELAFWGRDVLPAEVVQLYNNYVGMTWQPPNSNITVNLITPLNNSFQSFNVTFNATINPYSFNITNATLFIWYSNGTLFNKTVEILTGTVQNSTNITVQGFTEGDFTWNVFGCGINSTSDTLCNFASSNRTFTWRSFKINSQTYNSSVYETSNENFIINITYDNSYYSSISASLVYNGTSYAGTQSGSGDTIIFSRSINIPATNSITNMSFYWNVGLTSVSGTTYYNSTLNNQTVSPITAMNISTSCGSLDPAMHFDFKEEQNLSALNASIEYNFRFGITETSYREIYGSLTDVASFYLCINSSIHNNYSLSFGEIQYSKTNYADRRFYTFASQRLSNQTINNTLYLLLNSDATSFLFSFKDTSLKPYTNKYSALLRWYPNLNEYKVVEMAKTDDKGETIMRVKVEDVDYRVGLYNQAGTLIKLLNPVRFACLSSPCSYSTLIEEDPSDYTSFFGVETSIIYNASSGIWTFIWNDPSQNTASMRLVVQRERGNGTFIICDTTTSGFVGVITCDSSAYTGTIRALAYRTASPSTPIAQKIINTRNTVFKGTLGLFVSLIIFLVLAFIGSYSPVVSVILGIVGLFPAYVLGSINLSIFIGLGVIGGIIIHFMKRSE